jgi:hypothetical protein
MEILITKYTTAEDIRRICEVIPVAAIEIYHLSNLMRRGFGQNATIGIRRKGRRTSWERSNIALGVYVQDENGSSLSPRLVSINYPVKRDNLPKVVTKGRGEAKRLNVELPAANWVKFREELACMEQ